MKLNVSRVFEAGRVQDALAKSGVKGLDDFVSYLSDFAENVIRAFGGRITFADNFLYEERTVPLQNGIESLIQLTKSGQPKQVTIAKVTPYESFITTYQWTMKVDGRMAFIANFGPIPSNGKIDVTLSIHY